MLHALDSAGINTSTAGAAAACATPMSLSMTPDAASYPGLENYSPAGQQPYWCKPWLRQRASPRALIVC